MTIRTTRQRRWGATVEVVLVLSVLLVWIGWRYKDTPYLRTPATVDETRAMAEPPEGEHADVVVVIPTVTEASDLTEYCWDHVWLNAVEQEVGAARAVAATDVNRSQIDRAAWVIVPERAATQLDATQVQYLLNWVEDGGALLLEQPEGPWQGFTGQAFTGSRRRESRRITSFDGAVSRGALRDDLLEAPFPAQLIVYNPANLARGRDYEVLLEVDGQPGIISRSLGRGYVVVLLFDLGRLVGQMQQGRPTDDLRTPASTTNPQAPPLAHRMVLDPRLTTAMVPFADLLERNVLYLLDRHRPTARLWLYPGTHRGALLALHSEQGFGERTGFQIDWERRNDATSTLFATAGSLSPETLARFSRLDADVHLQWRDADDAEAPRRFWGIGRFFPIARVMTPAEQQARLNADLVPYGPVLASRAADGRWTPDWLTGFRQREAIGLRLDMSLGPAPAWQTEGEPSFGYLFGTGYPYRPIDASGRRFSVAQLPVVLDDAAEGYTVGRVRSLLVDASERYHTTIAADWRPQTMSRRPSFDALEGWRAAFGLARGQELWVTTVGSYLDFLDRRARSRVQSTFARDGRRLTIEATVVGASAPADDPTMLTPAISFPARYDGRPVERVTLDGETVDLSDLSLTGDRALHVLPLAPGEHRVLVDYAQPTVDAPALP